MVMNSAKINEFPNHQYKINKGQDDEPRDNARKTAESILDD